MNKGFQLESTPHSLAWRGFSFFSYSGLEGFGLLQVDGSDAMAIDGKWVQAFVITSQCEWRGYRLDWDFKLILFLHHATAQPKMKEPVFNLHNWF